MKFQRLQRLRLVMIAGCMMFASVMGTSTVAQEATPGPELNVDPSFSNQLLPEFGYPEITLRETGDGLEGVPSEIAAGRYLVSLEAPAESFAYVNFVQVPAGLSDVEAEQQLVSAARDDLPQEGWLFGGGSFADPGVTIHFIVDLAPGAWHVGATRESVPPSGGELQEWGTLHPLRVTATATPSASTPEAAGEPAASVTLELQDIAFGGLDQSLTAGPNIWEVTNVGSQPRQVVLFKTPDMVTADDMASILAPMMGGTPTPGLPSFDEFVWVGYVAILSPGQTVLIEFDLEPGVYTATSWVVDPETELPALLLGMVQSVRVT